MSSLSKPEVLLVIPVYNHSAKLREVVQKAIKGGWQVLVVNDGSVDVCKPNCHRKKTIMDRIEF